VGQSLIAGVTDYRYQPLREIRGDVDRWRAYVVSAHERVENLYESIRAAGADDTISYNLRATIARSLLFFESTADDLKDVLVGMAGTVEERHVRLLRRIGETARDLDRKWGDSWNEEYRNPRYSDDSFATAEEIYKEGRQTCIDLLDCSNAAERLADFVGRSPTPPQAAEQFSVSIRTYVRLVWRHAVNLFSALSLIIAFLALLPFWRGPWSIPTATVCAALSLLYATYLAWRDATRRASDFSSAAPDLSSLRPHAESILRDELERSLTSFRSSVSSTVAELGATGNRYSSALVDRLEALGVAELEKHAELILDTWRRLLKPHAVALNDDILTAVARSSEQALAGQRLAIQEIVNSVDMRRAPRNKEFLAEAFARCKDHLRAELVVGSRNV